MIGIEGLMLPLMILRIHSNASVHRMACSTNVFENFERIFVPEIEIELLDEIYHLSVDIRKNSLHAANHLFET